MKSYIHNSKIRFERLSLRERVLCTLLIWALIYTFLHLILFKPTNNQRTTYLDQIKQTKSQLGSLELQVSAIDKIATSPLYIEWKKQHDTHQAIQQRYNLLIKNFSSSNWHDVIKTVIANHPNITLARIENAKEEPFTPISAPAENIPTIFQQRLTMVIYGDYDNTIKYLKHIEKALPNIHWDSLKYEVIAYPSARITIGFSVFYDKKSKR